MFLEIIKVMLDATNTRIIKCEKCGLPCIEHSDGSYFCLECDTVKVEEFEEFKTKESK